MKASFAKGIVEKLKQVNTIWMDDATYKDVSGTATMTAAETEQLNKILSQMGTILQKLPRAAVDAFSADPELLIRIKTYNNSKVRAGEKIANTTSHVVGFVHYMNDYYKKEENSKKTEKGKQAVRERFKNSFGPIVRTPAIQLKSIFDFMNLVVEAKLLIIAKMNSSASIGTFLRTNKGLTITSPEGYVAVDHLTGGAVKLVDRLGFSQANFSADIIKGWQR
jgi:hypothetical protein